MSLTDSSKTRQEFPAVISSGLECELTKSKTLWPYLRSLNRLSEQPLVFLSVGKNPQYSHLWYVSMWC